MKTYKKPSYKSSSSYPNQEKPAKKKALGQHFLRKHSVVDHMIERVQITPQTAILEIGCGDGFLTRAILEQTSCKQLWCFEIDPEWAQYVRNQIKDPRLRIIQDNILDLNPSVIEPDAPWTVLANLPYQITFPIFKLFVKYKHLFTEGVVMVQEEVAQKIVASSGRSLGVISLYLQHHFDVELMEKIEPGAFCPPPKVYSRLVYWRVKQHPEHIERIDEYWHFAQQLFRMPRRTLRNNLRTTHFDSSILPEETLNLRAQQLSAAQLRDIWHQLLAHKEGAQ